MQNKKIKTEIIMLPVPAELFLEAGMFERRSPADVRRRA